LNQTSYKYAKKLAKLPHGWDSIPKHKPASPQQFPKLPAMLSNMQAAAK
jgi:hypothetical protein